LSEKITKNDETLIAMDNKLQQCALEQQLFIDNMNVTNAKMIKIIDEQSAEIEDLKASVTTLVEEL